MSVHVRIDEVLRRLGVEGTELLEALRQEGLFPRDDLEEVEAEELRVATCLMVDLGVNPAGVDVILRLRRRLIVLQGKTEDSLSRLLDEL